MDAPVPLEIAVSRFFPEGGVTIGMMRTAIRRGDLTCERIGRSYFVTAADIWEWRSKCRAKGSRQGLGSKNGQPDRDGSLSMEERKSTLAAALAITKALKRNSAPTLPRRARSTPAPATQLKLVSQT